MEVNINKDNLKKLDKYSFYRLSKDEIINRALKLYFDVKEDLIVDVIRKNNLKTIEEITNYTKAGGGCGKCKNDLLKILDNETSKEIN